MNGSRISNRSNNIFRFNKIRSWLLSLRLVTFDIKQTSHITAIRRQRKKRNERNPTQQLYVTKFRGNYDVTELHRKTLRERNQCERSIGPNSIVQSPIDRIISGRMFAANKIDNAMINFGELYECCPARGSTGRTQVIRPVARYRTT